MGSGRAGHFQVELHGDRLAEHAQVAVLNMAAIFAQMQRDAVGAAQFGQGRGPDRVGLVRAAGLAQRRYVVDIDAEKGHAMMC